MIPGRHNDPAYAGQQVAAHGKARSAVVGRNPAAQGQPPRYPDQGQYQQKHQQQPMQGQRQPAAEYQYYDIGDGRFDDGDSAMERAGYPRYVPIAPVGALGSRLGPRVLPAHDARYKLDRLHMSKILEEEGPSGPACFADRISREPPVPYFPLPHY